MLQAIYLGKLHTPLLPLFCTKKHMCCSSFGIKNEKHSTEDRSRFLFLVVLLPPPLLCIVS